MKIGVRLAGLATAKLDERIRQLKTRFWRDVIGLRHGKPRGPGDPQPRRGTVAALKKNTSETRQPLRSTRQQ